MNPDFWRGRRVFLTGHTGFKGSWMSLWLQHLDAQLIGYALAPPSSPNLFEIGRVADNMTSMESDIRNLEHLQAAMSRYQPEIVIHMAAQSLVRYSYQNPIETFSTNVMGTANLLEAVRQTSSVKSVVVVTSDKCYENKEWLWGYREADPMGGYDPYSSSKGCAELLTKAYQQSYFPAAKSSKVAIASVRAGNVIGGGDWADDRLIPDMIRAIAAHRSVSIRNPLAIRPWQHVLEPVSGYLLLAQKLYESGTDYAEAWNFGPDDSDARPVKWIVEEFTRLWGDGASWGEDKGDHPHEAHYLKLDCSKAKSRLGWQPRWSLSSALKNITAWHKAHLQGDDMRKVSLKQIDDYKNEPSS